MIDRSMNLLMRNSNECNEWYEPEAGVGLDEQLDAVEAAPGGGIVQGQGSVRIPVGGWHVFLQQQPAQHVYSFIPVIKCRNRNYSLVLFNWKMNA